MLFRSKNVNLNIVEVKGTTTNAQLVAEDVASQLSAALRSAAL